ncbi:MAG: hypothetical protein ACTHMM_10935 [Agriterribacter sp.]
MISEEELKDKYRSASIDELLNILDHAGEYFPEAIKAAQAELTRRRLDDEDIKNYRAQMITERQERELYSAAMELSFRHKAFFYFCWFLPTFLDHALIQNFKEDEAKLKLRQASFFKWAGIIILFGTVIFSIWFDLHTIATAVIWATGFFLSIGIDKKLNVQS